MNKAARTVHPSYPYVCSKMYCTGTIQETGLGSEISFLFSLNCCNFDVMCSDVFNKDGLKIQKMC